MKILLLAAFLMVGAIGSASAEVYLPQHSWDIGTEMSHIKYDEPGLMEEKGMMYGIIGSYTYRGWISPAPIKLDKYMAKVEGKCSWGQVDYDGQLMDGTPYTISDIDDYMLEFRGLLGYDFSMLSLPTTVFTPYIGFGYRYLNDDPSFDPYSYEREQSYFYSPIGIEAITELENGWSIGATLEYDIFWRGKNKSHFSDITFAHNDLEFKQDEGYGCRGSMKFQKKGEKVDFVIEPFIKYWNIKESDIDLLTLYGIPYQYYVEPKNNSTEIGGRIAVSF